ncbi:MAG TPA: hypothetical protein VE173_14100 [Longimicrobiales bacterium]|nr:hypothetical protein [Longimicrobiales bacterium]
MAHEIRRVDYFHTTVSDRPGEALRFLSALEEIGVDLLAFTAIPVGLLQTQLTIFPSDAGRFEKESENVRFRVDGPHGALLVQGDDAPGALVEIHEKLYRADVNVYASTAVASGRGRYGYIIYVRPEDLDEAAEALGL